MQRRQLLASIGLATVGAALAGCGTSDATGSGNAGSDGSSGGSGDTAADEHFPVTFEHAYGETTIERRPQRVVSLGWGVQDSVLALGVTPVGIPYASWGGNEDGIYPWTAAALKGQKTPTLLNEDSDTPVEKILSLKPDVVLAHYSGIKENVYRRLSEFAPTIAFPDEPWRITWEEQTTMTGRALGLEDKAKKLVADMHRQIKRAGEQVPGLAGKRFAYFHSQKPSELAVYVKGEPRVDLLREMGMELAPGVADLQPPPNQFAAPLGMENVDKLADADVLFTWFNDEAHQKQIESQEIFARLPAVRRGAYLPMLDRSLGTSMSTVTALGLPWGLKRYVPRLKKVVARTA